MKVKMPLIKDRRKALVYALSFVLPFLSMLAVYALIGIYPFGDKTVLVMDLDNQYNEFFVFLRRVFLGRDSLAYTFTKEMGGSALALFTYYLSSPFSILVLFFPQSAMPSCIALMVLLKLGASGLAFAILMKHAFKKCDLSVVLFSCCYALSTYAVFYSMCVMWLDAAIWLPIVILGIERVLRGKSPLVFIAAFTLTLFSNYYTAYMTAIFSIIYFLYRYVSKNGRKSLKDFFKKTGILAGAGAVGALIGAVILLPTFINMIGGKLSASVYVASGFWNQKIFEIPRRVFLGQYDSITNAGSPGIFCGVICGLMIPVYFFNSKIKIREKIAALCVFAVLFVSFFIRKLDMAWHVFSYPMWFPYRYAYVFCFFAVYTAFRGFSRLRKRGAVGAFVGMAVFAALIAAVFAFDKEVIKNMRWAVLSLILTGAYIIGVSAMLFGGKKLRACVCGVLIVLTCAELVINGREMIAGLDKTFGLVGHEKYVSDVKEINETIDFIHGYDSGFYRSEKTFERTDNDNMSFGMNGVSHYSSTFNNDLNVFNGSVGLHRAGNISRYFGSTLPIDSIYGIKYLVSNEDVENDYELLEKFGNNSVYLNPLALPIGFASDEQIVSDIPKENSFFKVQNRLTDILLNASVFEDITDASKIDNGKTYEFKTKDDGEYYLELSKNYTGTITISSENVNRKYNNEYGREEKIIYLGDLRGGKTVKVSFASEQSGMTCRAAKLDSQALKKGVGGISAEKRFNVADFGHTWLEGDVDLGEGEVLFTTIPYEKGWSVYVDGKKTEPVCALNTFIAIPAGVGKHHVKFKFHAPGLGISFVISLLTLLALITVVFRKKLFGGAVYNKIIKLSKR